MIRLNDIVVKFGDFTALHSINVHVKEGEFFTFLGPSGCGKTTTLRTITGFIEPAEGSVVVKGRDITRVPIEDRNIGIVFQSYALFPTMTVYDNIAFGLKVKKAKKDEIDRKVREIARKVDLSDEQLKKAVSQLSGGQQQRVAIARALVTGPAIICMDEPLSNLDAKLRVQLRNELKKMQKDFGITTIYVTHDQEEALTLSDRIAVFNKGIIEQIGTPNEVYNHSQTEFVCNFIGDINRLNDDTVSALRAAGAEVDASKHNYIRLERLHVNVAPRGGEIALDGTVESCEYYGLYIKYYIHVGTQSLKVIEKNDGVNIYDPGQRVKVILNPNDIMAYAPSAEEGEGWAALLLSPASTRRLWCAWSASCSLPTSSSASCSCRASIRSRASSPPRTPRACAIPSRSSASSSRAAWAATSGTPSSSPSAWSSRSMWWACPSCC